MEEENVASASADRSPGAGGNGEGAQARDNSSQGPGLPAAGGPGFRID